MTELYEAISEQITPGEFSVCEKVGDEYLCRYSGKLSEICDSLIAAGIIRHVLTKGENVYFIVNEKDLPEGEIEDGELDDDYDPQ
jgi:hypothetical protein